MDRLALIWSRLGERAPARPTLVGLWVTVLAGVWISLETHDTFAGLPKGETVSVLGLFLPRAFWDEIDVLFAAELVFWGFGALWLLGKKTPWSGWLAVLGYLVVASWFWENLPWFRHKYVPVFWILLVYACWFQLDRARETAPRWVNELAVFALASFYTFSGWSKLLRSGPAWGDGVSLQLWTAAMGDVKTFLTTWVLEERAVAAFLQGGTLFVEAFAFAALFHRWLRVAVGVGLIGLHLGVDLAFHIPFRSNIALLLWFFVALPLAQPSLSRRISSPATSS